MYFVLHKENGEDHLDAVAKYSQDDYGIGFVADAHPEYIYFEAELTVEEDDHDEVSVFSAFSNEPVATYRVCGCGRVGRHIKLRSAGCYNKKQERT